MVWLGFSIGRRLELKVYWLRAPWVVEYSVKHFFSRGINFARPKRKTANSARYSGGGDGGVGFRCAGSPSEFFATACGVGARPGVRITLVGAGGSGAERSRRRAVEWSQVSSRVDCARFNPSMVPILEGRGCLVSEGCEEV